MGKVNIDFTPTKYNASDAPDLVTGAYNQSMDDLKTALDNATAEDSGGGGDITYPIPIENGGTGANNAADARANLGITLENIGAAAETDLANYLPLTGGTLTGGLKVNNNSFTVASDASTWGQIAHERTTNGTTHTIRMLVTSDTTPFGSLQLINITTNTPINYMDLKDNETILGNPLTISSGGTGANTAEQARENLGIVDPTPVYVETEETSEPGLHIIVDSENNVLKVKKV